MAGVALLQQALLMVDLGRWLGGQYRFETPVTQEDLEDLNELTHSPETAAPSADPHREEA